MSSLSPSVNDSTRDLSRERQKAREAEELLIGPLLARANLLRLRQQWDEAIAVCTDALRRAPESASAHALMGDIYDAQSKADDAFQWYDMAVALDPENRMVRDKYEKVALAKRATMETEARSMGRTVGQNGTRTIERTSVLAPTRVPTGRSKTAERTLEWLDKIFPPGRFDGIARLIFAMSALLAVLLLVVAGVVVLLTAQRSQQTLPDQSMETGTSTPPGAVVTIPSKNGDLAPVSPVAANTPSTVPPPVAVPPAPATEEGESAADAFRAKLASALPVSLSLNDADYDASAGYALVEVTLAPNAETIQATRERVLRAAVYVGRTAAIQESSLQRLAVRILLRNNPDTRVQPELVFVGDITAASLREADPVTGTLPSLQGLFSSPWWSSSLAVAGDPPTP